VAKVLERLQKIIAEQLGVEKSAVTPDASLTDDLNADSADLAELMPYIEKEFSFGKHRIEISDDEIEEISSVQDIIDLLHDKSIEDED
jgi:acyl carrier protein